MTFLYACLAVVAAFGIGWGTPFVCTRLATRRSAPALSPAAAYVLNDREPAEHQSLDQGQLACKHDTRAVAVVPARGDAPVGWLCPDCLATMPEPQPLGPRTPSGHPSADDGTFGLGTIRAGTITASKITAGSITMGGGGVAVLAEGDTYEVHSHQSATPVRTFTADGREDFRATNYAALLAHAGHTPAETVAAMVAAGIATPAEARALHIDAANHTAAPMRVNTGLGRGWPADDISSLL